MWVCLNRAFLSIVQPGGLDAAQNPGCLQVRARRPGDIEKVFPNAVVVRRGNRDYLFRAFVPQSEVGVALMNEVMTIDYSNFKGSTHDKPLHDAYMRMWDIHAKLQPTPPYRGNDKPQRGLFKSRSGLPYAI